MADPKPWQIINALVAQLSDIRVASGYLTDAGANIWAEPAQRPESDALGVSIITESIGKFDGQRPAKQGRALALVLEAEISTTLGDAHQLAHQLIEDLEVAVASFTTVQQNAQGVSQALPVEIGDIAVLERPEGLPVIAVQMHVTVGYWR